MRRGANRRDLHSNKTCRCRYNPIAAQNPREHTPGKVSRVISDEVQASAKPTCKTPRRLRQTESQVDPSSNCSRAAIARQLSAVRMYRSSSNLASESHLSRARLPDSFVRDHRTGDDRPADRCMSSVCMLASLAALLVCRYPAAYHTRSRSMPLQLLHSSL